MPRLDDEPGPWLLGDGWTDALMRGGGELGAQFHGVDVDAGIWRSGVMVSSRTWTRGRDHENQILGVYVCVETDANVLGDPTRAVGEHVSCKAMILVGRTGVSRGEWTDRSQAVVTAKRWE